MTLGAMTNAMIRTGSPQRGQTRGSTSKMRRISAAHNRSNARRSGSIGAVSSDPRRGQPGQQLGGVAARGLARQGLAAGPAAVGGQTCLLVAGKTLEAHARSR